MELHGGTLEVYSAGEGKGCSFCFKIPMTRGGPGASEDSRRAASGGVGAASSGVGAASSAVCGVSGVDGGGGGNVYDDHDDDGSSNSENPGSRNGMDDHDVDDDYEIPSPRRRSRDVSIGPSKQPSPALPLRPSPALPLRSPRRISREQSPAPQLHGSVEVTPPSFQRTLISYQHTFTSVRHTLTLTAYHRFLPHTSPYMSA